MSSFFLIMVSSVSAYTIENYEEKVEDRFVISPVNLELKLSKGEKNIQNMTIVNRLGRTVKFKIEKEDFAGSDDPEKSTVFFGDESSGVTSAKDWIMPEINEITLNHGDRLTLPVSISVPQTATAGSHYGAIFVSVESDSSSDGKDKVKLISRVGLLLLMNIPGDNRESGNISEFSTNKKFYKSGPVGFSTIFQNTGNVYERVKGEVSIRNILGDEVGHISLKEWVVLSNSSRKQTGEWDNKWLLGRYTAHLTVFYGLGGNLKAENETVFYAFPWHVAILVILIFVVIYYLIRYLGSKFEIKRKEKNIN